MAYAILYNRQDLTPIVAECTKASLQGQDKQFAARIWREGLDTWDTAPVAPLQYQQGDPDTRIVVINTTTTLQELRDFLYRQCNNNLGAVYMCAIADDLATSALDPWPVP